MIGRRPDGYHLLDSVAVFAGAADRLTATAADGLRLTVVGPFALPLAASDDNLVLRAARALAAAGSAGAPGAELVLDKRLPVAAGIGGGSADAAAALRLLNELWRMGMGPDGLAALAKGIGADVPVCLASRPARMQGIGEVLRPAPRLPACGLVLVNPGMALPTPAVFAARGGPFSAPAMLPEAWEDAASMAADLQGLGNDLEAPAIALCPAIADVLGALRTLPGCLLARMSGSGATCFGLFDSGRAAAAAAATAAWPGWWSWGGPLRD